MLDTKRNETLSSLQSLLPAIAERAPEAEQLRQIPAETIDDLRRDGLLHIINPKRYGGSDQDLDILFEAAMQLGSACGSTGWCFAVWMVHNWMLGHWPEQAQEEYFSGGPDVLCSSAFAPTGKLVPVEDGFRLTGRWGFSSGADAGAWALLSAMGPEGPRMALVPRQDYEVIDTWFVSGLRGTGSKDIAVESVFVPSHRICQVMGEVQSSNAFDLHGRDSYRLPPMSLLPFTLCSPLVGMAQGAVDSFSSRLKQSSGGSRGPESVALQLHLAESTAEVDAARLLVRTRPRELIEQAGRGETPSPLQQAAVRRDYGFVAKLAVRAVNRLFEASGGHALFDMDPIQRFHRDVHAGSHQVALRWDFIAEDYGRAALGLPALNRHG